MTFTKLEKLIDKNFGRSELGRKVQAALVLEKFSAIAAELAGAAVAKKIRPLYIKDRTIVVACLSSVVAQELRFVEEEILRLLNDGGSGEVVSRIRYVV